MLTRSLDDRPLLIAHAPELAVKSLRAPAHGAETRCRIRSKGGQPVGDRRNKETGKVAGYSSSKRKAGVSATKHA